MPALIKRYWRATAGRFLFGSKGWMIFGLDYTGSVVKTSDNALYVVNTASAEQSVVLASNVASVNVNLASIAKYLVSTGDRRVDKVDSTDIIQ